MEHSLEWITELARAADRLDAKHALRLSQAVSAIMDGPSWSEMQQRLIEQMNG